jgi:hypothetical protein
VVVFGLLYSTSGDEIAMVSDSAVISVEREWYATEMLQHEQMQKGEHSSDFGSF